jgi:hypothetical protein
LALNLLQLQQRPAMAGPAVLQRRAPSPEAQLRILWVADAHQPHLLTPG